MDAVTQGASSSTQVREFLDRVEPRLRDPARSREKKRIELGDVVFQGECFSPDVILGAVAAAFGVDIAALRDRSSRVLPRFVAMFLLHEYGRLSYLEVAAYLGMKNHTSVRYGAIDITVRMADDADLSAVIEDIVGAIRTNVTPRRVLIVRDGWRRPWSGRAPRDEGGEQLVERALLAVAAVFDVSPEQVLGRGRDAQATVGRHVAIYLLWKLGEWSTPRIGRHVRRDHSTVLYACDRVRERLAAEPRFASRVGRAEELMRAAAEQESAVA
jgi:chromosomal replication initiation ATPase DnaA